MLWGAEHTALRLNMGVLAPLQGFDIAAMVVGISSLESEQVSVAHFGLHIQSCLCNNKDRVLKMKEVKIQMFRNYSRDFYQQVVYKFKTRILPSRIPDCPILTNLPLPLFVVLFTTF